MRTQRRRVLGKLGAVEARGDAMELRLNESRIVALVVRLQDVGPVGRGVTSLGDCALISSARARKC
jgi:hypothetical protein